MNLHEYQGKELFAKFGLPVSKNKVITSADDVVNACRDIGGNKWVVKAQVHAGGRGKAGGVKLVSSPEEGVEFANHWLGKRLITYQTDSNGQLVNSILVEAGPNLVNAFLDNHLVDEIIVYKSNIILGDEGVSWFENKTIESFGFDLKSSFKINDDSKETYLKTP